MSELGKGLMSRLKITGFALSNFMKYISVRLYNHSLLYDVHNYNKDEERKDVVEVAIMTSCISIIQPNWTNAI